MVENDFEEEKNLNLCTPDSQKYKPGNEKYLVDYVCDRCGHRWSVCLLSYSYPEKCPVENCQSEDIHIEGYRTTIPNAKFIADFLTKHYLFIIAFNKNMIWTYDGKKWNYEITDRIIREEAQRILGERLKEDNIRDIKLHLLTNIERVMKEKGIDIGSFQLYKISKYEGKGLLINFQNATVYVDEKKVEIRPHKPEDYFMGALPWDIDLNINKTPKNYLHFIAFLANGNPYHFIDLLEALAWPLFPGYFRQKMFVLIGQGNNGKSTFYKLFNLIYGEDNISALGYSAIANAGTSGQNFTIGTLHKKLANISDDFPEQAIKDANFIKMVTGESKLHADIKFVQGGFDFYNDAKMFFGGNSMPEIPASADGLALWRRFHFIQPLWIIQEVLDWESHLKKIFEKETPAFLKFLILYIVPNMFGKNDFPFAERPSQARTTYLMSSDNVKIFGEKRIVEDFDGIIRPPDLYNAYYDWCLKNNTRPVTSDKFYKRILKYFPSIEKEHHTIDGKEVNTYRGIRLIEEETNQSTNNTITNDEEKKRAILEDYISAMFYRMMDSNISSSDFEEFFSIIKQMKDRKYRVSALPLSIEKAKELNQDVGLLLQLAQSKPVEYYIDKVPIDTSYIPVKNTTQELQEWNEIITSLLDEGLIKPGKIKLKKKEQNISNNIQSNDIPSNEQPGESKIENNTQVEQSTINEQQVKVPKIRKRYGNKYTGFLDWSDLLEFLKENGLNMIRWLPSAYESIFELTLDKTWGQIDDNTKNIIINNFDPLYTSDTDNIRVLALIENPENNKPENNQGRS